MKGLKLQQYALKDKHGQIRPLDRSLFLTVKLATIIP